MEVKITVFLKNVARAAALTLICSLAKAQGAGDVYGWVEMATIEPWGVAAKAKLDTGALTSSIHAEDVQIFKKDGKNWVRFTIEIKDEATDKVVSKTFERPRLRRLKLRGAGGEDSRAVVLMQLCIKDTIYEEQFSLRDRDDMNYPILLGRRTIESLGLVDVRETYLHKPRCKKNAPVKRRTDKELDEDIGVD